MTNPRRAAKHRRLTPLGNDREMGGHKGYGLAVAVEILSSLLPGLRSTLVTAPNDHRVGHFFLALDPKRFRDEGQFESDLDGMMDSLRQSKPIDRRQPVLVSGDPEYAAQVERRRSGIPLSRGVIADIRAVCRASGVPFILEQKH